MVSRNVARMIVGSVWVVLALYVTTGVGLFGRGALAVNHALANKVWMGVMTLGERYFQAHPLIPGPPQTRPVQTPPARP